MFTCNTSLPGGKALALAVVASPMSLLMVNQPPVLNVEDKTVDVGEDLDFVVFPIDADGVAPERFPGNRSNKVNIRSTLWCRTRGMRI